MWYGGRLWLIKIILTSTVVMIIFNIQENIYLIERKIDYIKNQHQFVEMFLVRLMYLKDYNKVYESNWTKVWADGSDNYDAVYVGHYDKDWTKTYSKDWSKDYDTDYDADEMSFNIVTAPSFINGNIEIGVIAEFIIYVNMLTWPVTLVGWVTSIVKQAEASQKRINEFLDSRYPAIRIAVGKVSFEL